MNNLIATLMVVNLLSAPPIDTNVGNRLVSLDEPCDPYYVGLETPKLTTPQWVGDPGVDAVIVLAIDDLQNPARYEEFIRPIVRRLKHYDPDAGMSVMTIRVDPADPLLPKWHADGVTVEVHTADHPCPLLQKGDFAKAKQTYDRCLDALHRIPNARPVAFRMPCCDSMNSVSPRFFTEVFNRISPGKHFLSIDSSVFHIFSAKDAALPRSLVYDQPGRERFRKYVPRDHGMVNLIEDYPYPYVIGKLCWEIPCVMPSDWDAQHLHGNFNPATVADLKAAVDATIIKKGIFSLCFHPHGWIRNDQVVELIDYAHTKYGKRVKFLNFRQVQDRLDRNLLGGHPLRNEKGQDNGVRVLDLDNDGFLDVVAGNSQHRETRVWSGGKWQTTSLPAELVATDGQGGTREAGVRFGVLQSNGQASMLVRNESVAGLWHFDGGHWVEVKGGLGGLDLDGPVYTSRAGRDQGVRLRDLDGDGISELLVGNLQQNGVFRWSTHDKQWERLPITLPPGTQFVDENGRDAGLRMVDVNADGRADVLFSNATRYLLHVFTGIETGWSHRIVAGSRDDETAIPMIVRADGTNNGVWFSQKHMWIQNENTGGQLPHEVDSRSFTELLAPDKNALPRSPE